ncbi:MAG: hydroxymethylglutaryl-CoA lyase [Chitinophagaceae bacterium]|nr:hydroxymethylglutaryl-CoA lyase [Chitinophagaceae bacterium]
MIEQRIHLVECPRDAMQGWKKPISTEKKIAYLNQLLKVGFHTLDFGSFVSPKAIPQMADTAEVVARLDKTASTTQLLAIIANLRGAEQAVAFDQIDILGFPFSVSETFQQRNTQASMETAIERVADIQDLCVKKGKELVVYISMGFGNPYGDPYDEDIVFEWVNRLVGMDIGIISLADTVGVATPEQVYDMTGYLVESFPGTEIGVHLHSRPDNWKEKLEAAWKAGCRRFDGAIKGIGGCPMADDELVGNLDTLNIVSFYREKGVSMGIDQQVLLDSLPMAEDIFQ